MSVKPALDNDGIIRADTKMWHAAHLSYDTTYPIILPRKKLIGK